LKNATLKNAHLGDIDDVEFLARQDADLVEESRENGVKMALQLRQ